MSWERARAPRPESRDPPARRRAGCRGRAPPPSRRRATVGSMCMIHVGEGVVSW